LYKHSAYKIFNFPLTLPLFGEKKAISYKETTPFLLPLHFLDFLAARGGEGKETSAFATKKMFGPEKATEPPTVLNTN
jgi:hypothetical protein